MIKLLSQLSDILQGDLCWDSAVRHIYATDASSYRELPLAVAYPKNESDLITLVNFATENQTSLIPRTAGTSLAGQVVGSGIVVDVSKHFTKILEVNEEEKWVRVQPGVIRDELNRELKKIGLFFGPETSTANRAMIGGMIGNNSCGSNSVVYGSTRDHLLEAKVVLSNGQPHTFKSVKTVQFGEQNDPLGIYSQINQDLGRDDVRKRIIEQYPKSSIPRRNTGYAIDLLAQTSPFEKAGRDFNFCELLAGSEGTLALITEAKLALNLLPPKHGGVLCVHFDSIHESLEATIVALDHQPSAVELMDHYILEQTKTNIAQKANRFFLKGDPKAILVVELRRDSNEDLDRDIAALKSDFENRKFGYHHPFVKGEAMNKVWNLRKAGLGLLSSIPGDPKPVPVVEDTAVDVRDLPAYIAEFNEILKRHDLDAVHYAHAGSGEIHLRPILDLKTQEGNEMFRTIAEEIAELVKKYNGSLSGEHGDGRLRGEFIPKMVGEENFEILKSIKNTWDPNNIFNPGKIVDTPPMNSSLRFEPGQETPEYDTAFKFSKARGIVRAVELCNGSGDCRKTVLNGGVMCPSYMATGNEKDTTRARANIFRELAGRVKNDEAFSRPEMAEIFDLCISCKGCTAECPSNVDIAKIKAEFLHQKQKLEGTSFRTRVIANLPKTSQLISKVPWLHNFAATFPGISNITKYILGFAQQRSMPSMFSSTLRKWVKKNKGEGGAKRVALFIDEFSNFFDVEIGIKTVQLLRALGYDVVFPDHEPSARTYISKGMLTEAKKLANTNVKKLSKSVSEDLPLIGIEPSAILTFRDEYPDLVDSNLTEQANKLAKNVFTLEEFLANEIDDGKVNSENFTSESKIIHLHGHCHQKALSSMTYSKKVLSLPSNFEVRFIQSTCCGMAGSFGMEKEHYEVSMQIGEVALLPKVREIEMDEVIVAAGTSCRHQIKDGAKRKSFHPVEVLWEALIK